MRRSRHVAESHARPPNSATSVWLALIVYRYGAADATRVPATFILLAAQFQPRFCGRLVGWPGIRFQVVSGLVVEDVLLRSHRVALRNKENRVI